MFSVHCFAGLFVVTLLESWTLNILLFSHPRISRETHAPFGLIHRYPRTRFLGTCYQDINMGFPSHQ
jgi:hypothetical protein